MTGLCKMLTNAWDTTVNFFNSADANDCHQTEPTQPQLSHDQPDLNGNADVSKESTIDDSQQEISTPRTHDLPLTATQRKFKRRAAQRWCRLVTATKSRLSDHGLAQALGPHLKDFQQYANKHFKTLWEQEFTTTMSCQGCLQTNTQCPYQFVINPHNESHLKHVSSLHLDHSYTLKSICTAWKQVIQSQPGELRTWHQGVNKDLVCHLLFGVHDHPNFQTTGNPMWKANVNFRCCRKRQACHDLSSDSHSELRLTSTDLACTE